MEGEKSERNEKIREDSRSRKKGTEIKINGKTKYVENEWWGKINPKEDWKSRFPKTYLIKIKFQNSVQCFDKEIKKN